MSGLTLLLWAAPILLVALPAMAGDRENKERDARTACLGGDYAKGVMLLSELFVSTREVTYIYNQGRCFEQNGRYQEAIVRFQEYLRVAKGGADEARAEAQKHIADCRAQIAQEASARPAATAAPAPAAPPPVAPPAAPQVAATPIVPPLVQPVAAESPESTGRGLRVAGVTSAAVGVVAVATGVLLNLKANSLSSEYETYNGYTDGKESTRQSYETWSWVSYGAGAACIGTGVLLYYLGARGGRDASQTSVSVAPAPGGASFVVRGAL